LSQKAILFDVTITANRYFMEFFAPDKFHTAIQTINSLIKTESVPEDEVDKYMLWVAETADSIGIGLGETPGFQQFADQLPARKVARTRMADEGAAAAKGADLITSKLQQGYCSGEDALIDHIRDDPDRNRKSEIPHLRLRSIFNVQ
jgi:hypothetical protein